MPDVLNRLSSLDGGVRARTAFDLASLAFCSAWAATVLAFPAAKAQPAGYIPVVLGGSLGLWLLTTLPGSRVVAALERIPPRRFLVMLLVGAAFLRLIAVMSFPIEPRVDDLEIHEYAIGLLHGAGYGEAESRAWMPPGMSFALAGWYAITTPSALAGKILQAGLGCVLVWQTLGAVRDALPERTARAAAILVAVFPTLVFYTATLGYEILLAVLLTVLWRLTTRLCGVRPAASRLAVAGLVVGFSALVKPIGLLLPIPMGLAWWSSGLALRRAIVQAVLVSAVMTAVVAPWTLRNYFVLGAFVPISTNGGGTLYSANNPLATGRYMPDQPLVGETGEVSRDRAQARAGVSWIVRHPLAALGLVPAKVLYTWGTTSTIMSIVSNDRLPPAEENACKAVLNAAWSALLVCCAGAAARGAWATRALVFPSLLTFYVVALHVVFEGSSRHHIPVLMCLCAIAAVPLTNCSSASLELGQSP